MDSITIDPLLLEYALPALAAGLLLGVLVTWLVSRHRRREALSFSKRYIKAGSCLSQLWKMNASN